MLAILYIDSDFTVTGNFDKEESDNRVSKLYTV